MTAWNDSLAQYLRILQSEGYSHLSLSPRALKNLRALVSSKTPSASSSSLNPSSNSRSTSISSPSPIINSVPLKKSFSGEGSPEEKATKPKSTSAGNPISLHDLDLNSGSKGERIHRLREKALNCQQCEHLACSRTQVVFGVGNPEAKLMFVGEAPGADEDEAGEPFVGKAGQLLTKMIQAMGIQREEVYIANVLKCRPDMPEGSSGNRKPTPAEMQTCVSYLKAQIQIIQPQAIVALGATALEGLLLEKTPISKLRGSFLKYEGIPMMATYHPAYLLRNQSITEKRKVWEDLLKVMEQLQFPISEKQRSYFLSK